MITKMKAWARTLKKQVFTLYFAYKDDRTSWFAKIFTAIVVAYAFSPIDLIPDFIPVLGLIDDIIIVPLGVLIALKLIPTEVLKDCEVKAEMLLKNGRPKNWLVGIIIIAVWLSISIWMIKMLYHLFK